MNKIGIIGNGFVGNAIHQGMKEHFEVLIYDKDPSKKINTFARVSEAEIIFICVPTPMTEDGDFDLRIVKDTVSRFITPKILVIKSTITPSAAQILVDKYPMHSLVFNPEFLTERTAVRDFQNPSRIVLGGNDQYSVQKVEEMYRVLFPSKLLEIIKTDVKDSMLYKVFFQLFLRSKSLNHE